MFKPVTGSSSPKTPAAPIDQNTPGVMDLFESLSHPTETPAANTTSKEAPEEEAEETTSPTSENETPSTDEASDETAESPDGDEAELPEGVLEVNSRGKKFQFKLDRNDKKLQQTLAFGLEAPKLAADKKALKRDNEALTQRVQSLEGNSKYAEAAELASAGFLSASVKDFLGEEAWKKFYNEEIIARIDYENASPEEKLTLKDARHARDKEEMTWRMNRGKDGKVKGEQADKEAQAKAKEVELEGHARAAIGKHNWASLDSDKTAQEVYKRKVYKAALDDLEEWAENHKAAGKDITPTQAHIEKAIERNYNLLTGARGRGKSDVKAKASSSASDKKAAATAAKNYDKGKVENLEGLSPLGIFNKLRGSK